MRQLFPRIFIVGGILFSAFMHSICVAGDELPIIIHDGTCSSPQVCPDTANGESIAFWPKTGGLFDVEISVECTGGKCSDFNVCAFVTDESAGPEPMVKCFIAGCGECRESTCGSVCLTAGRSYRLHVSLTHCNWLSPCASGECVGTARLVPRSSSCD